MNEPRGPQKEKKKPETGQPSHRMRTLGIALMAAAVLIWLAAAVVLFLPITGAQKAWTTSALLVGGEVFFWISAALLGRELFRRYRSYLDPRRLFRKSDR